MQARSLTLHPKRARLPRVIRYRCRRGMLFCAAVMCCTAASTYADCTANQIALEECPFSPPGVEKLNDAGQPVSVCHVVSAAQSQTLLYTDGFAEMPAYMACSSNWAPQPPAGYTTCCSRVWPADAGY
jgi:hypothetical protein